MLFNPGQSELALGLERGLSPLRIAGDHASTGTGSAASLGSRHRFRVGDRVTYSQTKFPNMMSGQAGVVIGQLPTSYFGPEYLIRFPGQPSGFIAGQNELTAALPAGG